MIFQQVSRPRISFATKSNTSGFPATIHHPQRNSRDGRLLPSFVGSIEWDGFSKLQQSRTWPMRRRRSFSDHTLIARALRACFFSMGGNFACSVFHWWAWVRWAWCWVWESSWFCARSRWRWPGLSFERACSGWLRLKSYQIFDKLYGRGFSEIWNICSCLAFSFWSVVLPISAGASSAAWYILGICTSSTTWAPNSLTWSTIRKPWSNICPLPDYLPRRRRDSRTTSRLQYPSANPATRYSHSPYSHQACVGWPHWW